MVIQILIVWIQNKTYAKRFELRQKTYLLTCAPSEDLDQHVFYFSLIRIFTVCILDGQECMICETIVHLDLNPWFEAMLVQNIVTCRGFHSTGGVSGPIANLLIY